MAAKRTGRKKKLAKITLATVSVAEIDVDNPLYQREHDGASANPRKIRAAYNPRESYAGYLWFRKRITDTEFRAASWVRQNYELMGGAGAGSIDYAYERVDGGQIAQDITAQQIEAGRTLKRISKLLGPAGYDLVIKLAGEGKWPRDLTGKDEKQRYLSHRFRECLEHIAVERGWQSYRELASGY